MPRGKRTRESVRGRVRGLLECGVPQYEICERTGLHESTVRRIKSSSAGDDDASPRPRPAKRRRRVQGLLAHDGVARTLKASLDHNCTMYHDELARVVTQV